MIKITDPIIAEKELELANIVVEVGESEPFTEVVLIPKDTPIFVIQEAIQKYLSSDEGSQRDSDDAIVYHLIDEGLVVDYVDYNYITV